MRKMRVYLIRPRTRPFSPGGGGRAADLEQIKAISDRAQTVWYALLGAFLYLAVTVNTVRDADFFAGERTITLPIVGVPVGTLDFFLAGPLIAAILYAHFHLFQIRLWRLLGEVSVTGEGGDLDQWIRPWQLTNAALVLRARFRRMPPKGAEAERVAADEIRTEPFALFGALVAVLSAWVFGPAAIGYAWWRVLSSRDDWAIGSAALALMLAVAVGAASLWFMWREVRVPMGEEGGKAAAKEGKGYPEWAGRIIAPGVASAVVAGILASHVAADRRVPDLRRLGLPAKHEEWLPEGLAFDKYLAQQCKDRDIAGCNHKEWGPDFQRIRDEWRKLRPLSHAGIRLKVALAPNVNFSGADLSGAYLVGSRIEGADLSSAILDDAVLEGVEGEGAVFDGSTLTETDLSFAVLWKASFRGAFIVRPGLSESSLAGDFSSALIVGNFVPCPAGDGDCVDSPQHMLFTLREGFDGSGSTGHINDYFLPFQGSGRELAQRPANLFPENLSGAALRFTRDIDPNFGGGASLEKAFGDKSVARIAARPCHWPETILGDEDFFRTWKSFRLALGLEEWPPSEAIGDLTLISEKHQTQGDGSIVAISLSRIKVRELSAEPMPACSPVADRPCFEPFGPQFAADGGRICKGYSKTTR